MAASRMSRTADRRLTFLSLLVAVILAPALSTSNASRASESVEDVEVIPGHVVSSEADGDVEASASPFDLKKHNSNGKKFQKVYPKTESEWNFKGEGKKTDVYIKDSKDNRLLRLITEGLITPQDILPVVSNDAITSSQKNVSNGGISVTVQPEGMSGIMDDGLAADSDEEIIMEKKKNATREKVHQKLEVDLSRESDENVKINLDANAGVQSPLFNKLKDSITVPAQKQISLSKGKESHIHKKLNDANFDVISLRERQHEKNKHQSSDFADEGVFDFIDTPLSNKNLVPAGTAQTSRINVKKGPNGQDYEYEYVYYYYYDDDEASTNRDGKKPTKSNEIPVPVSSSTPSSRTTTPISRHSQTQTPTTRITKNFEDGSGTSRIKSTNVLNEPIPVQSQKGRDKFNTRPDYRYPIDNTAKVSSYPTIPNKPITSNDLSWQYEQNNNRFPGRQIPPQSLPEHSQVTIVEETAPTRQSTHGRAHYNTLSLTTPDDSNFLITARPVSMLPPPRETQTRGRSIGNNRQPGLELVDSNSFRTHSTRVPNEYEQYPTPTFENPTGKSLKQNSESTISQNIPSVSISSTKGDILKTRPSTSEYNTATEGIQSTLSFIPLSSSTTETNVKNTAPESTLPDGALTTVYGAGLTDKAAHDLYAIYQQKQNEETVRNTITQDDRTTTADENEGSQFIGTNLPITTLFVPPATTITTTTTTTTLAPSTTITTTTTATPPFNALPGKGRYRGSSPRGRHTTTTSTSEAATADSTNEATEKTRSKFQPQSKREPGHRISAYARKSTTVSLDTGAASFTSSTGTPEVPTRQNYASRNRYRGSSAHRSENSNGESLSTSAPSSPSRPSFSDRFNSRRRPASRTSTTSAPPSSADEESTIKAESSSETNPIDAQQSTTFKSTRNRYNQGPQIRPLRPGPKINLTGRGRFGSTSTTVVLVPLDTDTSGSADIPVEQKHTSPEENVENGEVPSDTSSSPAILASAATTSAQPDTLHRLKNRPKLRINEKVGSAKVQTQQSNNTVVTNQNRKHLLNNLLPRKKQSTALAETHEVKEEKIELSPRPVSEDTEETASKANADTVHLQQQVTEVSSTTESKLSSLLASRRRNLSRKPGPLTQLSKQTTHQES